MELVAVYFYTGFAFYPRQHVCHYHKPFTRASPKNTFPMIYSCIQTKTGCEYPLATIFGFINKSEFFKKYTLLAPSPHINCPWKIMSGGFSLNQLERQVNMLRRAGRVSNPHHQSFHGQAARFIEMLTNGGQVGVF